MRLFSIPLLLVCSVAVAAPVDTDTSALHFISISKIGTGTKYSASISFGFDNENYCTVSFKTAGLQYKPLSDGADFFTIQETSQQPNNDIAAECSWNGSLFVSSTKPNHDGFARFGISEIDRDNKHADVLFSLRLLKLDTAFDDRPAYFDLPRYRFSLTGSDFDILGVPDAPTNF
ncbi:hypothetical protein [Oceanobacter mangrovi]|uniref:hypothetical protein n=1 Tax=Oceanobacter mangrovi TaxID=2862510 RepID=UPI001C8D1D19|nr:hypothetical protein [Oceanobacter mangrovi]